MLTTSSTQGVTKQNTVQQQHCYNAAIRISGRLRRNTDGNGCGFKAVKKLASTDKVKDAIADKLLLTDVYDCSNEAHAAAAAAGKPITPNSSIYSKLRPAL